MKKIILMLLSALVLTTSSYANRYKAIGEITKGLAKWAAVGAGAYASYKAIDEILKDDEAAYAFYMEQDTSVGSLYWADVFSKPDIYVVITIDGIGTYLLPEVRPEYSGEQVRWNLRLPPIPEGTTVLVQVYDDDTSSDEIWNGILQANGRVMFDGGQLVHGLKFDADLRNVNVLKRKVTLDARDYVCQLVFKAPSEGWFNRKWTAQGRLKDSDGRDVGVMGFAQLHRE